ncbi:Dysferlin [Schistosoma japonicum]|nr:Dysferlin [Schistosoma japonicum]
MRQKQKTKVKDDDLNPIWDEEISIDLKGKPLLASDNVLIKVMDFDKVTPDKFMGQTLIPLQCVLSTTAEVPICVALQNKKGQDTMVSLKDNISCILYGCMTFVFIHSHPLSQMSFYPQHFDFEYVKSFCGLLQLLGYLLSTCSNIVAYFQPISTNQRLQLCQDLRY